MEKIIHYCWFGGNPLPKLAKKCIKSWKKYLPDFQIIEWNESNVNLEECKFIKEAYKSRKWAFVADYVRTKALYEMGGIYFDTDMEVTKDISKMLNDTTFLGVEDSGKIAVGVWYEKNPNSYLTTKLLNYYQTCDGFDSDTPYAYSIPNLITNLIDDDKFVLGKKEIQNLKNGIVIYPRDYFYPLSYNRQNNIFTENTCMIHYYDASWIPKYAQIENRIYRYFGNRVGRVIVKIIKFIKRLIKYVIKIIMLPINAYKNKKKLELVYNESIELIDNFFDKLKQKNVIAIYRKDWLGTSYATKELFDDCLGIKRIDDERVCNYYAKKIVDEKINLIIFSAFDITWAKLIQKIKELNQNQKIKVLWHGSNAMNIEEYDWSVLRTILEYSKFGLIDSIGFVKKSLYEFYKTKGIKAEFVMNTINLDKEKYIAERNDNEKIKIGLYASGDRWLKNFYNQLSAASMIENHIIDCIPKSEKTMDFANIINANLMGESKPLKRDELLKRLALNDINLYVTFVECAPLLPLESFELGVPCITSNNHHYWEGTELEKYLVVNAPDNIIAIKNQIEYVLKNKDKIITLYKEWKKEYDIAAEKTVNDFINK